MYTKNIAIRIPQTKTYHGPGTPQRSNPSAYSTASENAKEKPSTKPCEDDFTKDLQQSSSDGTTHGRFHLVSTIDVVFSA